MAFEWETGEYRRALYGLSELQRTATEHDTRAAYGMTGDKDDARD